MQQQTISRGDGNTTRLKTEAWQHDPYKVYMPVTARQYQRLMAFQSASAQIEGEDGQAWPTAGDPLRWGRYDAAVHLIVAAPGQCPHC